MWPRVCELFLAIWLIASPFVLGHVNRPALLASDLLGGTAVGLLAVLSFTARRRRAHLGTAVVATGFVAWGYLSGGAAPTAAAQSDLIVGLTLLMLSIIPSEASKPPTAWRTALITESPR